MADVMTMPRSRSVTVVEWLRRDIPADGHRYELIDGTVVVSPPPALRHQDVVGEIYFRLRQACPTHLRVGVAPLDVRLGEDTVVQPDVVVYRAEQVTYERLIGVPMLAVEVLSPSTRRFDLLLKQDRYERAGIRSYWTVDPATGEVIVRDLDDSGRYGTSLTTRLAGGPVRVERPFPVELRMPG